MRVTCIGCPRALPEGLSGLGLPPGSEDFRTEATFKHSHYVESADIVTACYQGLASWSFDPGGGEVDDSEWQ